MSGIAFERHEPALRKALRLARRWLSEAVAGHARPARPARPTFVFAADHTACAFVVERLEASREVARFDPGDARAYDRWKLKDLDAVAGVLTRCRAPVAVFEPVLDAYRARTFLDRFPEARVVFVARDLDAVIRATMEELGPTTRLAQVYAWLKTDFAALGDAPPPPATREAVRRHWSGDATPEVGIALYWLFHGRLFYDLGLDAHPRARLVACERLSASPRAELASLSDFLGIRFDERMLHGLQGVSRRDDRVELPYVVGVALRDECEALAERQRATIQAAMAGSPATAAARTDTGLGASAAFAAPAA